MLELSDRVSVLRKGTSAGTVNTADADVDSLAELMVGEKVELDFGRTDPVNREKRIDMQHVFVTDREGKPVLT